MKVYKEMILKEGLRLREFDSKQVLDESTWHRDMGDRIVEVVKGNGWKIQVDDRMPILMREGDVYKIPSKMWHRIIPGDGELSVLIREIAMKADTFGDIEPMDIAGMDALELADQIGEEMGGPISPGVSSDMIPDLHLDEDDSKPHMKGYKAPEGSARDRKLDAAKAAYKRGDLGAAIKIRDEMEKQARNKPGYKTRKSKYSDESKQPAVYPPVMSEYDDEEQESLMEGLGAKTREALKKKAESHNAPLGALTTVYKKGLGAFYSSGSRPGMTAHQWAMARVNSFLKGGKARKVDSAQWKKVQDFRKK